MAFLIVCFEPERKKAGARMVARMRGLSVNSPALILSKNSGVSWLKLARIGSKSAKIG